MSIFKCLCLTEQNYFNRPQNQLETRQKQELSNLPSKSGSKPPGNCRAFYKYDRSNCQK